MQADRILYEEDDYKCIMLSIDDEEHEEKFLSVNQYLIVNGDEGLLIDPGCAASFDDVFEAVSQYIDVKNLKYIFFSHQDPDVAGSLAEWGNYTSAKLIFPAVWSRFMAHYGLVDNSRIIQVQDAGMEFEFSGHTLHFIPSHFMHSPGQFSIYDESSKILFSGDIGAAVLPISQANKEIESFEAYVTYLEQFHKRFMANNKVCRNWVKKVRHFEVDTISPQHGMPLKDTMVEDFLNWLNELKCGADLLDEEN